MDAKKTGAFIGTLRRQRGLTQAELAERIGVTDKAVSRWETGKGFPDLSLLQPLAAELGTSVAELLAGEALSAEERAERADSALLEAIRYTGGMGLTVLSALLAVAGCFLFLSPLFTAGQGPLPRLAGAALLVMAAAVRWAKFRWPRPGRRLRHRLSPGAARAGTALCLLAAFILELTPYGAVLVFGRPAEDGTIGRFRETYSYFSLMPVGYANFFPMLTGILTAILLGLGTLHLLRPRKRLGDFLFVLNAVALVFSVMPWVLFGPDFFSAAGASITGALLLSGCFLALGNSGAKNPKKEKKAVDNPTDS